jgi:hypothetical protein
MKLLCVRNLPAQVGGLRVALSLLEAVAEAGRPAGIGA